MPEEQGVGCSIHPRGTKIKMVSVAQWQSFSVVVRVVAGSNPVGHPKIYKLSTFQGIDRINRLLILNDENDEIDKYQKRLKNRRVLMSI